jgi:creatinine amidohydrolase/Fe(II)-dependent formamide hydrolase-like protein/7-cyano-7-deazaguanine synthase in queuosine biosynthesis
LQNKKRSGDSKFKEDPFKSLGVIDRLEVGPAHLERKRIKAAYHVTQNGKTDTTELIYRFEEDVFKPDEPESLNLASMISVQVALNYGLFCNEIILHGWFDEDDQRFIKGMAENTAREIYVKKLLEPNPFLVGPVTKLPSIKKETYSTARIVFDPSHSLARQRGGRESRESWYADPSRYAVMSSGGKDSLLSFGLMRELGKEVHPVFINESGRHWFTALNAYRYFAEEIPHTARVWTNSDRVFNWMLRQLPFIRQDFSKVRSDEYPIRLWTVAVFLFGTLPILRKRGIGRLLVGDEFDTTRRLTFKSITHYDGLYDQSRYFDNAMTRYFHRKAWGISQFSVLRPLSELLVEKTLVERYPELQSHQVSCHACHKEGERVHPCGRCEKCRRIVGMLTAIGAEPGHCGYSKAQIEDCLRDLAVKDIHQETEGVEHLAFLLNHRGALKGSSIGRVQALQRPEVMRLRFDSERSPVEGIPANLREPLYRLLLSSIGGSVKRRGRTWTEFDLLSDHAMKRPDLFDTPKERKSSSSTPYLLGELTWPEAEARFKEVDIALLPVGSIEQHGPHMPLDADAFDADYLARRVAEACKNPKPMVLPLVPYGVSYHHEDFSGTISVSPETLSQLIYEIGVSASGHGISKLIIINGHGGNSPALHFAAQMINRDAHIFACVDTGESSDPDIYEMADTPNDVHAGEIETSMSLATRPDLVKMDVARKFIPKFSSRYLNFTSKRSVGWYAHTSKISRTGVLGDPTKADRDKGERMWSVMITRLVEFVEDLKDLSLDEIYQRRY